MWYKYPHNKAYCQAIFDERLFPRVERQKSINRPISTQMRILLLSDTHSYLDPAIAAHAQDCDEIWHAGDIGDLAVADQLAALKPLRAVYGNIDGPEARHRFPEVLEWESGGLKVYMTHIGGYPGKYPSRIRKVLQERQPDLFICGHSHILKVMPDPKLGLLHLNPGACGRHGFHRMKTMLRFDLIAGKVQQLAVIELGLRGKIEPDEMLL